MTKTDDNGKHTVSPQYKKNFLTDVIFRIDYPMAVEEFEASAEKLHSEIKDSFPVQEPIQTQQYEFKIDATTEQGVRAQKDEITFWRYKSEDGKQIVELQPGSLIVNSKEYTNYSLFEEQIRNVTSKVFQLLTIPAIERLGLRYINQITLDETDLFAWSDYLNENLVTYLDFYDDKSQIRRAMQVSELAYNDDTKLNFKYGIYNSLYPNKIIKKEFVLDFDCYTQGKFEKESVLEKTAHYNKILTEYFEKSITNKLKDILNEK